MNRKHIIFVLFAVFFAIIGTSCSTKKVLTNVQLQDLTVDQLVEEVENNSFDFDNLQAKLSIKIEANDKSHNVKGHLRMKNDSIIWVSISIPMGAELFRAKITSDSLFFINKNDKYYMVEPIGTLDRISPTISSIGFIQSVLIGNDVKISESVNYNIKNDVNHYKLISYNELIKSIKNDKEYWTVIDKELLIEPSLYRISKHEVREKSGNNRILDVFYDDFVEINNKNLPTKLIIMLSGEKSIKISIEYSGITTNDNVEYSFKIPKKYERKYLDD